MKSGFFIGPFYPVGLYVLTKVIPEELHVGAMGEWLNLQVWHFMLTSNRLHCKPWTGWISCLPFHDGSHCLPGWSPGLAAHHGGTTHWNCLLLDFGP